MWVGREATLSWRNICVDFPPAWTSICSKKDTLVQAYSNCKTLFQVCSRLVSTHQHLNDPSLEQNCLVQKLTTSTFGAGHATPESFTCRGDSDSLHTSPRKVKLHSPKYHRSCPDFSGAAGSTQNLTATQEHTCLCSITKMTQNPIPKSLVFLSKPCTCPYTAQLPNYTGAPSAQATKQCPFYCLDKIPSVLCCAEAASQNCPASSAHLQDAAVNPKRDYLTCHSVTSLTASNGKGTGEKCCKLINIRPLVAVCYCKQTF